LGKLAVWAEDRPAAIARMRRALNDLQIEGVRCNQPFHAWILDHPEFIAGQLDTGFIERNFTPAKLDPSETELLDFVAAAAIRAYEVGTAPALPVTGTPSDNRWVLSGRLHEGNI
jgi:acetyl/propionyl-CoA carboxylase alpha subunit